jgi:hypothetical protein
MRSFAAPVAVRQRLLIRADEHERTACRLILIRHAGVDVGVPAADYVCMRLLAPRTRVLAAPAPAEAGVRARALACIDFAPLLLIAGWKLVSLAVMLLAFTYLDFSNEAWRASFVYPDIEPASFRTALQTWDGSHYLYLAEQGYSAGHPSNAFYPLYPLSIRAVSLITGDSLVAALLISNLASAAGLWLLYAFVQRRFSRVTAWRTLVLFLAFPTAFFLNVAYSEGLFLLLTTAFLYLLYDRRYAAAAAIAFLLPFARPLGVAIVLPAIVFVLVEASRATAPALGLRGRLRAVLLHPGSVVVLAPLAGFAAYLAYMYALTGDALASFHALETWGNGYGLANALDPRYFVDNLFHERLAIHSFDYSILDRVFFLGFVASLPLAYRRLDKPLFVLCLALGLSPLLGSYQSYMRYVLMALPMFIAYGSFFTGRLPRLYVAVLTCLIVLQVEFTALHVLHYWAA